MAVLRTNIDTSDLLNLTNEKEGQSRYQDSANPISFSTFFIFVTGLISVLIGVFNFSGKMFLRLYSAKKHIINSILGRFLFFELIYLILIGILFAIIILSDIYFNLNEIARLIDYLLFLIVTRFFLYVIGLIIGSKSSNNKNQKIVKTFSLVTSLILVIFLLNNIVYLKSRSIESVDKLNVIKLKTLMDMERGIEDTMKQTKNINYQKILDIFRKALENYLKEGYRLNEQRELAFLGNEKEVASFKETISAFFPPSYYQFISKELSNAGDSAYHLFKETSFNYKYQFTVYYIQKRFYSKDKAIESFIKTDENIIPNKVVRPKLFIPALGISIFLCSILFLIVLNLLQRYRRDESANNLNWIPKPGVIHFKLFSTENDRDIAFQGLNSFACLDKDDSETRDYVNIGMLPFVNYFIHISGTDKEKVFQLLRLFDVQPSNIKLDSTLIKKIYAAIILAHDGCSSVVMNDFIKNEDHETCEQFEEVLRDLLKTGKSVLYLSSQMYNPKGRKQILTIADITEIDINIVSLK
jgi:hypothetical protein